MKLACKYYKDSNTITLHFPNKFDSINLSDGSVTTAKLASGSVTTLKIVDEAIEAVKLATASITSEKVATAAIGSSHLQDALVTTAKIANLAVDASRLADLTITAGKLASSCVEASKIANLAVGAAAIASGAIGTAKIADAAILEAKIDNAAVTSAKIYDAAIVSAKIADLAVIEAKIGNLAVNNAKIANLDATKVTTGYLSADRIETGSIVLGKITGTGELIIESGGKVKIDTANALEITATGDIKVMAGGDLHFTGSSYTTTMNNTASGNVFYITASTSNTASFVVTKYKNIKFVSVEHAEITAKTDDNNKAQVIATRSGGSSFAAFDLIDEGVTKRIQAQYENNTHYSFGPTTDGECNLGASSTRWKEAYFENVSAATDNASGWAGVFSNDGNNANRYGIKIQCGLDNDSGEQHHIYFYDGDGGYQGTLSNDTSGNLVLLNASDKKLKTNIVNAPDFDTDKIINGLQLREYDLRGSPGCSGLVAQEAQMVFPEMTTEIETKEDGTVLCVEANTKLTFVLLQAIKELKAEVDILKGEKL